MEKKRKKSKCRCASTGILGNRKKGFCFSISVVLHCDVCICVCVCVRVCVLLHSVLSATLPGWFRLSPPVCPQRECMRGQRGHGGWAESFAIWQMWHRLSWAQAWFGKEVGEVGRHMSVRAALGKRRMPNARECPKRENRKGTITGHPGYLRSHK